MSKDRLVHVGTSGWNYRHWKEKFYPKEIPQTKWFDYYITKFDTVELNTSFYHLPKKETFKKWNENSPDNFYYAVKASRYITHLKRLKDVKESVNLFIDHAINLKDKLGPILFQLPPGLKYNKELLISFLELLPDNLKYTMEFRNNSWWNDEVYELLDKNNISFCIYELAGVLTPRQVTGNFIYTRLHGPGGKYAGSYSDDVLEDWANFFVNCVKEKKTIYCYFDNDDSAYAAYNALTLRKFIEERT